MTLFRWDKDIYMNDVSRGENITDFTFELSSTHNLNQIYRNTKYFFTKLNLLLNYKKKLQSNFFHSEGGILWGAVSVCHVHSIDRLFERTDRSRLIFTQQENELRG